MESARVEVKCANLDEHDDEKVFVLHPNVSDGLIIGQNLTAEDNLLLLRFKSLRFLDLNFEIGHRGGRVDLKYKLLLLQSFC